MNDYENDEQLHQDNDHKKDEMEYIFFMEKCHEKKFEDKTSFLFRGKNVKLSKMIQKTYVLMFIIIILFILVFARLNHRLNEKILQSNPNMQQYFGNSDDKILI